MLFENTEFINYQNNDNYNIDMNIFGLIKEEDDEDELFNLKKGFLKGNMFKKMYDYYKDDMVQELKAKNEKQKLELDIYALDFAVLDLSLYLDVYPNNKTILKKFKKYSDAYKEKVSEYEKKYGPLNLTSTNYSSFKWIDNPWPWDKRGGNFNV